MFLNVSSHNLFQKKTYFPIILLNNIIDDNLFSQGVDKIYEVSLLTMRTLQNNLNLAKEILYESWSNYLHY